MINCVVIQWNDIQDKVYSDPTKYSVVNWNYNIESPVVAGLEDDLEVLEKVIPYTMPVIDYRLYSLEVNNIAVDEVGPNPPLKQFQTIYTILDRSIEEKKISIDEMESDSNYSTFPSIKQLKYLLLYIALTRREALGLSISAAQQAILDKGDAIALKVWQNHINALSLKEDLDNSIEIDLDEGWETTFPEDE